MKLLKVFGWIAILLFHWIFIQNDFINISEEDESFDLSFDIFFILVWLMGFIEIF